MENELIAHCSALWIIYLTVFIFFSCAAGYCLYKGFHALAQIEETKRMLINKLCEEED